MNQSSKTAVRTAALLLAVASLIGRVEMGSADESGEWTELFSGQNLNGWQTTGEHEWTVGRQVSLKPDDPQHFAIQPGSGIFVNGERGRTKDIFTSLRHGDCELHIEFVVPEGSNSGVYLMGHYEIQILDSWGVDEPTYSDCGGIYCQWIDDEAVGGTPPNLNASRPPGEWQTYDVVFRAPRFDDRGNKIADAVFETVVHNGKIVHTQVAIGGPTRASMPGPEKAKGPLMLQGDHGPVAFRNVRIRPLD